MNTKELAKRRAAAMPEVKALVKKFGRQVIASCLTRIREAEKGTKKLEAMKREVAALEKRLAG
jgi:hypothetical protein